MSHWLMEPRGLGPVSPPRPPSRRRSLPGLPLRSGPVARLRPAGSGVVLPFSSPRSRVRRFRQRPEHP